MNEKLKTAARWSEQERADAARFLGTASADFGNTDVPLHLVIARAVWLHRRSLRRFADRNRARLNRQRG